MKINNGTYYFTSKVLSPICFVFCALSIIFVLFLAWQRYNPWGLSFSLKEYPKSYSYSEIEKDGDVPEFIIIPETHMELRIFPSVISKGKWETTNKGVSYLTSSARPGHSGNSIFYGHNWPNLLGYLSHVRKGDTINIITKNHSTISYIVEFVTVVTPDQTHVIENSTDFRLTLYTCTGWFDTKRLVVTARLNS